MVLASTVVPWSLLCNVVSYACTLSQALLLGTNPTGDGDLWTNNEGVFLGETCKEVWEARWNRDRS